MADNNNSNNGNGSTTITVNGSTNLEMAQSNQDLLVTKKKKENKRYITIGLITLVTIAIVVAVIVLIASTDDEDEKVPQAASITLDDFLRGKFASKSFNGTWASGHEIIYNDFEGNLVLMNLRDNTKKVLLNNTDPLSLAGFDFQLSADGLYLLAAYNYGKLYRHSYLAQYAIININTGEKINLLHGGLPAQLAVWATTNNALVFVFQNNIYYKTSVSDKETVQITSTNGTVSNGVPDWVYEEEVFSSNRALWFSPDGKKLAYGRFNDTEVNVMILPIYGEPGTLKSQYPKQKAIKYPKAGDKNPTVTLHYVDLANPTVEHDLQVPSNITKEQVLTTVEWANNDTVVAIWMNRVQNQAVIESYDTSSIPVAAVTVANLVSTQGWLELFTAPIFSKDGSQFVLILSQDQGGNAGGYRHVVLLNNKETSETQALTKGKFVVTEIIGWNHDDNTIFYMANTEDSSSVQHLYSVSVDTKDIKCHTCHLKSKFNSSTECLYNTVEFSKNTEYYVHTCAGPDVPQVAVFNKNGEKLVTWASNDEFAKYVGEKMMPKIEKREYEVADGFTAKVMLRLPPNMDTSGETKYPMLVNVYGGPDTYQVTDKFYMDWGSYLAANKSIIYAAIDGRGSGLRGDKIMYTGYRKLGTVEVIDQVNVTRQIQRDLPYVDASRTAIWGWSYGGYVSGMALATDKEGVFKCGISVAPVTDWALYDSIYTERFMGLPTEQDNLLGYKEAELLKNYEGLRGKEYFLIHGTLDDNVHYQQSMLWSKMLELNDILFRQQSYPDEDHNLGSVRPHLYHSLESFLDECFIGDGV